MSLKPIVALLIALLYVPFLAETASSALKADADFATFYRAAKVAFVEHRSPYTRETLATVEAADGAALYPYLYPPPSLLGFYPLTFFSYENAKAFMFIINHSCVLLVGYLLLGKIMPLHIGDAAGALQLACAAVYMLVYTPLRFELFHGQIDLVVLTCLCCAWLMLKQQRAAILVALPLSVAIILKTYPLAFLPLLLLRQQYRALFYVGALLLLAAAGAYVALPTGVWSDWCSNVLPTGGYGIAPYDIGSPAVPWNEGINGFTSRLFLRNEWTEPLWPSDLLARVVPYTLALAVIGSTIAASYIARARTTETLDLQFALYLLMMFLVSPLAWEQHLVFALPAAFLALRLLLHSDGTHPLLTVMIAGSLLILAWSLPLTSPKLAKGVLTLAISAKLYAVVFLWALLLRKLLAATQREHARSLSAAPDPA